MGFRRYTRADLLIMAVVLGINIVMSILAYLFMG